MTIHSPSAAERTAPATLAISHPIHFLSLLAGLAGAVISPSIPADTVSRIAQQHIENWNQTLRSGNIDDILDLYDGTQPMLLQPNGEVATTIAEIAQFWRTLLTKGDNKLHFELIETHKHEGMIIARVTLSHTGLQRHIAVTDGHDAILIYCVITQQKNGQWKTQIQKWN